jgi:hypothetical protein
VTEPKPFLKKKSKYQPWLFTISLSPFSLFYKYHRSRRKHDQRKSTRSATYIVSLLHRVLKKLPKSWSVFGQNKLHCLRSVPFLPHLPWSQAREPGQGPSVVGRWLRRHWLTWIFEIYIYNEVWIKWGSSSYCAQHTICKSFQLMFSSANSTLLEVLHWLKIWHR